MKSLGVGLTWQKRDVCEGFCQGTGLVSPSTPQKRLRSELDQWMKNTADPRAIKDDDHWDSYPYFGGTPAAKGQGGKK
jgi:hypothetical protein